MRTHDLRPHADARHKVLAAAALLGTDGTDLFMTLLQDRLPVWMRTLDGLTGDGPVEEVLTAAAHATIDFYAEIQPAGLIAVHDLDQLVRLRHILMDGEVGPRDAIAPFARYLTAAHRAGRIPADTDPAATAELLVAACFHHAMIELLHGPETVPPRAQAATRLVRALRLTPKEPTTRS